MLLSLSKDHLGSCPDENKVNCSMKECENDKDCSAFEKCCSSGKKCGRRCVDGYRSKLGCIYKGKLYKKDEMFKTNDCTTCTCKLNNKELYYEANCNTENCIKPNCDKTIKVDGQCCPICLKTDGEYFVEFISCTVKILKIILINEKKIC